MDHDNKKKELIQSDLNNRIIVTAKGNIYDITTLLNHHPGGNTCILNKNNTDVTDDYNMHCHQARKEWKKYRINNNDSKFSSCIIN